MFGGFFIYFFFFPFWCILLNRFASNCNKQMEMSDKNISIITNTAAFCNKASNVLKQKCGVGDRRETYKLNPNKAISIIHHTGVCVRVCVPHLTLTLWYPPPVDISCTEEPYHMCIYLLCDAMKMSQRK